MSEDIALMSLTGVAIPGGNNKVLRLEVTNGGDFNVNYLRFTQTGATPTVTPTRTATPTATTVAGCAIGATLPKGTLKSLDEK